MDSSVILSCEHKYPRNSFCENCQKFVCRRCSCMSKTGQCKPILIRDYVRVLKEEVEKKIRRVDKVKKEYELQKAAELVDVLKDIRENNEKKVVELVGELQREIGKGKEHNKRVIGDVIKKIEEFCKESEVNMKNLESKIEDLEELKEDLNRAKDKFSDTRTNKADIDMSKASIIKGYDTFKSISKDIFKFNKLKLRELELQVERVREPEFMKLGKTLRSIVSEEAKGGADFLHYLVPNSRSVVLFDFNKNVGSIRQITADEKIIPVHPGVASDEDYIYIVGGTKDLIYPTDNAFKINVGGTEVKGLAKLNVPRYENALAKLKNFLVCVGGQSDRDFLDSTELLDITEDAQWTLGPTLPFGLCLCATTVVNAAEPILFVYGGMCEEKNVLRLSSRLFSFSLEKKEVEEVKVEGAPALHSAGMIAVGSSFKSFSIMIFGGCNRVDEAVISDEVYTLADNKFSKLKTKLASKDTFFCSSMAINENGAIYAMGNSMVHKYCNEKWEALTDNYWLSL